MPKTTLPRKTWQYTKEFKIKAVKLTLLYDYKVKDVANSLGIHRCMLSRWRKEFREGTLHGDDKLRLNMPTKKKVISSKKLTDIDKLRQENEKLKKWFEYGQGHLLQRYDDQACMTLEFVLCEYLNL